MTTKWMRLATAGAAALVAAASLARGGDLQPAIVPSVTGNLHINQPLPLDCDAVVRDVAVTGGHLEFTPADGVDIAGGKSFVLTRANMSFAPFHIQASCHGESGDEDFSTVSVQLAHAAPFTGAALGGGVYTVTIPRTGFQLYEAATVNGELSTNYLTPLQDVTGTIDLAQGTLQLTVVIATKMHFSIACIAGHCLFDDDESGTLTTTISGAITFPDSDGDGVPNRSDTCPLVANPNQAVLPPTPVITAPPGVTLASCTAHTIGTASSADVCDGGPVALTNNAPSVFTVGANVVTWTATDAKHRTASANETVTIVDTTAPVFTSVPPDVMLNNCVAAPLGTPVATDDCAGTPTFTNNAPAIFPVGDTHITWTATDASGNHATDSAQTVRVVDTTPPTVSCRLVQSPGNAFRVTSADACGLAPIRLGSFTIANGETIAIEETGQSGITLNNTVTNDGIRHFKVGKGQAIVTATDGGGNVSSAICR
jgi:hypothetical protein